MRGKNDATTYPDRPVSWIASLFRGLIYIYIYIPYFFTYKPISAISRDPESQGLSTRLKLPKKTRRLPFIPHLQHGWDTHQFWAALEPNTGIQWEPKSASKILWSGKAELHHRSCGCCQWSKGAPQKSSSKASVHQEIWLCRSLFVFPSIRKGGWMNRARSSETLTSQLSLEV